MRISDWSSDVCSSDLLLGSPRMCRAGPEVVAHLRAHVADFATQRIQITFTTEHTGAHPFEVGGQLRTANQHPRTHQRLVLPGPGFLTLVALEGTEGADQQPGSAGRTQAHVHLVQLAGGSLGSQQMNDALTETGKELRGVDGLGAIGLGGRVAVMDEHQIQVGTVTELDPADLAVPDADEGRIAERAVAALRLNLTRNRVAPGQGPDRTRLGVRNK